MPTPKKGPRLGGSPSHQRKILANLATQLIENRSITTTVAKAKLLQPYFEKMVTKARRGDVHARRTVAKKLTSRDAVYELFDVIVPEIDAERNGGYTRITKIGNRKGDNAPMAVIEIITEPVMKKATVRAAEAPAKAAAKKTKASKKADTLNAAAVEAAVEEVVDEVVAEAVAEEIVEEIAEEVVAEAVAEEIAEEIAEADAE